jgi:YD repeat-containing protein
VFPAEKYYPLLMKTKHLLLVGILTLTAMGILAQSVNRSTNPAASTASEIKPKPVESEGLFFTDASQTKLYSGGYQEYYENGELRLDMMIVSGKPEGPYVVYFDNGRPNEVRSYHNGKFHGVWRTYNRDGMLVSQAQYIDNKKHGKWMIWDDNGIQRYEMEYTNGERSGTWYMWDEKGRLLSEKTYN